MSKKEDIIKTALDLFTRYSFGSVGVDRIIKESGVAKMTFYNHFSSKEMLIETCLIRRSENIQSAIQKELSLCCSEDHLGKIKIIYIWYTNWFRSDSFSGCILQKAILEIMKLYPTITDSIVNYRIWLYDLCKNIFGNLNVNQPEILSLMFINILDGLMVHALVNHDHKQIEESWKYIERLITLESLPSQLSQAC